MSEGRDKTTNETVMVPVDDIKGAEYNPRTITPKALAKLKTSLREFGMPQPVIVNKNTSLIVGGHQRLKAAIELGWEEVPVTYMDLTDDEEKALNVALNNGELTGDWDLKQLAKVLESITDDAILEATGFDSRHIDKLLEEYLGEEEEEVEPVYPLVPRFLESYDYVVVFTTHETDWANLQTMMGLEIEQSYKNSKIGIGRVVPFEKFRDRFENARQLAYGSAADRPHAYQHAHELDGKWVCGVCGLEKDVPVHDVPEEAAGADSNGNDSPS